jgi:hypothetical protein
MRPDFSTYVMHRKDMLQYNDAKKTFMPSAMGKCKMQVAYLVREKAELPGHVIAPFHLRSRASLTTRY